MDGDITSEVKLLGFPEMEQMALAERSASELQIRLNELFAQGWSIVAGTIALQPETKYTYSSAFAVVERKKQEAQ